MKTTTDNNKEQTQSHTSVNELSPDQTANESTFGIKDKRPTAISQRKIQEAVNQSSRMTAQQQRQDRIFGSQNLQTTTENGLSSQLKNGIESQSETDRSQKGNSEIGQLKQNANSENNPLQFIRKNHNWANHDLGGVVNAFVQAHEAYVKEAEAMITTLQFLNYGGTTHMLHFIKKWNQWALTGFKGSKKLLAAAAGYWIESYVTEFKYKMNNFKGIPVSYQEVINNTRPDVTLTDPRSGGRLALIDLTSKNEVDHILGKSGSVWKTTPFVVEVMYDSIDFDVMSCNYQATGVPNAGMDIGALQERYERQKDAAKERRGEFALQIGEALDDVLGRTARPTPQGIDSRRGQRADTVRELIERHFGQRYTPVQIGDILAYGGLNPQTYGFKTGGVGEGLELLRNKNPDGSNIEVAGDMQVVDEDEMKEAGIDDDHSVEMADVK